MIHSKQSLSTNLTGVDRSLTFHWHRFVVSVLSCAALAVGLLTAVGGPAKAIDEWSTPVTVDATVRSRKIAPSVAMSKDGSRALAVWGSPGSDLIASWWTTGAWSPPVTLGTVGSDAGGAASIALSADGTQAVVVWDRADEDNPLPTYYSVRWVRWTGTAWTSPATLSADAEGSSVSMSEDGATVLASWAYGREVRTARLAGGAWSAPHTVTTTFSNIYETTSVSVAARQSEKAMVSWSQDDSAGSGTSQVGTSLWSSGAWSAPWLGPLSDTVFGPVLRMNASGTRAFQVWPYRGDSLGSTQLRAAVWRSGNWGATKTLGTSNPASWGGNVGLTVNATGKKAVAMWAAPKDGKYYVQSRTWRGGDWKTKVTAGVGVGPYVDLAGGETTGVWRGVWGDEHSVRTKLMPGSNWRNLQKIGRVSSWEPVSFDLSADGSTGMAVWGRDRTVKAALLERYGKATKVRFKVRRKSANRSRVKVTWAQPDYATGAKVKVSKPNRKKFASGWKSVTKPVYRTTVKRGKKYWVKIRVETKAGRGPAVTRSFRS